MLAFFTGAGEISPFGVYVPTTWDGHTPPKLLLILHGVNEDQNSMLDRDGGIMGQSMGGAGAWYLAQKYREKWAALVATAAAGIELPYPYERLRGMPIICGV